MAQATIQERKARTLSDEMLIHSAKTAMLYGSSGKWKLALAREIERRQLWKKYEES